jgi:MFS family permease
MVGIMAIAPVWIEDHGHGLGLVGSAVSLHVLGMFGPSPLTGWLADRVGAVTVARGGVLLLLAAAVAGTVAPAADAAPAMGFLLLLGVGWNAGVVGASAMLTAAVPADHRARAEGAGEVTMGVAAALCGPGAGLLASRGGFAAVCAAAAVVSAVAVAAFRRTG